MGRITGGGAPAELWRSFMTVALKRVPVQPIPAGPAPPPPPPPVALDTALAPAQPAPVASAGAAVGGPPIP
jgi:penicillin-binding protein 1A